MTLARRARKPRVLYLSFFFPPSRASGVYRARATANHLVRHGWDVTAFAAPMRFLTGVIGSVDEDLATTVAPEIRVERPALHHFPWEHDLRRFGRFRGTMPILARKGYQWSQKHVFPEAYSSWGAACVARALRLHARRPFDAVLATGNPFSAFAAAWAFHKLTGVPYMVDYRDSWTLNLFTDSTAFPDEHRAWWWERRILRSASAISFVNQALLDWHAERYPQAADRMVVVPNGWDPDLMAPPTVQPHLSGRRPLRFAYLGTLTNNQPVEEFAAAFTRARQHPELADAELNIYGHLGFFKSSPRALMERLGLKDGSDTVADSGIRYRGPVSKVEVASIYQDSDVLVFLAGGGRYVTSGKIFEYMAAGHPIVSVHHPDIAAREVLEGYPLWFSAGGLDVDAIAQSMIAAGKAARDLTPEQAEAARQHAETYTRDNVLHTLESRLRGLVRSRKTTLTRGD